MDAKTLMSTVFSLLRRDDVDRTASLEAVACELNEHIAQHPEDHRLFAYRARVHTYLDRHEDALADYDRAIDLHSVDGELWFLRGICHYNAGNFEEAIRDINFARDRGFETSSVYQALGDVYRTTGDVENALFYYGQSIERGEASRLTYITKAEMLMEEGHYGEAFSCITALLNEEKSAQGYEIRALALMGLGEYSRAIRDFSCALELDQSRSLLHVNRGVAYFKNGEYERAADDFRLALTHDGGDLQVHFYLGLALEEMDNEVDAIIVYQRLLGISEIDLDSDDLMVLSHAEDRVVDLTGCEESVTTNYRERLAYLVGN